MALGDDRRSSGRALEESRRASGRGLERNRRDGGTAMETGRRGQEIAEDLNRLVTPPRQERRLRSINPQGNIPAQRARADYTAPRTTGTGTGGIASPLVEPDALEREYYSPILIPTTDGLAWVRWRSVKTVVMQDANEAEVILEFANGLP